MKYKSIKNDEQFEQYSNRMDYLIDLEKPTEYEKEELDLLSDIIFSYESKRYPDDVFSTFKWSKKELECMCVKIALLKHYMNNINRYIDGSIDKIKSVERIDFYNFFRNGKEINVEFNTECDNYKSYEISDFELENIDLIISDFKHGIAGKYFSAIKCDIKELEDEIKELNKRLGTLKKLSTKSFVFRKCHTAFLDKKMISELNLDF